MALDTETTGLDPWGTLGLDRKRCPARPFSVQVCNADGEQAEWMFRVDSLTREVCVEDALSDHRLRDLLADENVTKVKFNATFDERMLEKMGFVINGEIIDVMHACHAISPVEFSHELKYLAKKYAGMEADDRKSLMDAVRKKRLQVSNARKKVALGEADAIQREMAAIMINEQAEDEYTGEIKKDTKAARADMWLEPALARKYGGKDALMTAVLKEHCFAAMDDDMEEGGHAWETFRREQELRPIIKKMEDRGIRIDVDRERELAKMYIDLMEEHSRDALKHVKVKDDWQIASTQSLQREFLVNHGLKPISWAIDRKTKKPTKCSHCKGAGCSVCWKTGDNPQVDNDFLAEYGVKKNDKDEMVPDHALCWHVLHYKAASAMLMFLRKYAQLRVVESPGVWILHPNFKQTGTNTARMASENPNLQNVADDDSGKKKSTVPYLIRDVFVPRKGRVYLAPDYSQIEIWMLYLHSKDPKLGEILLSGGDTHGKVAQTVVPGSFDMDMAVRCKKLDMKDLTSVELANLKAYTKTRKKAKNTQFCKVYGGGPAKIAETAGCELHEAKEFAQMYDATFSGVKAFMDECIRNARQYGYVENAFGRRYQIDPNRAYISTNYVLQGGAADLIKRAMIRVYKTCIDQLEGRAEMLLQIHDELLIEIDEDLVTEMNMKLIAQAMQADYKLLGCPVPFPVGMKVCDERWSKSREIKL